MKNIVLLFLSYNFLLAPPSEPVENLLTKNIFELKEQRNATVIHRADGKVIYLEYIKDKLISYTIGKKYVTGFIQYPNKVLSFRILVSSLLAPPPVDTHNLLKKFKLGIKKPAKALTINRRSGMDIFVEQVAEDKIVYYTIDGEYAAGYVQYPDRTERFRCLLTSL